MKILFLTDGLFPYVIGGMQKHSTILIQQLASKGIVLDVVHPIGHGYSKAVFTKDFNSTNIHETVIRFPKKGKLPGHYIRENRIYSRLIYEEFKDKLIDFDLIYAQGFTGSYFIKAKRKNLHQIPVVVNLHGFEMFQFAANLKVSLQYLLLKKEAKFILKNADWVYSFGGKLNEILNRVGVKSVRILDQSNGIQNDWLLEDPNSHEVRTFIFIGRNERRKGIIELHQALKKNIQNSNLRFRFNFIGHINETEKILDSRITYFGEIKNQNEVRQLIDQSDILVCPSYAEGMPTVILEAMARGLAIIATDVGAVCRMIDGNGILLDSPDTNKLMKAIQKVIEIDQSELELWKQKSLRLVKDKFLWSKVVEEKLKDFYRITKKK